MAIDVTTLVVESLKTIPGILVATGGLYAIITKQANKTRAENEKRAEEIKAEAQRLANEQAERAKVLLENQNRIEAKVNGNHKITMKAIKLAGKYEGHQEARREVKEDLVDAVRTVKTAAKRGTRRSTDK